MATTLLVILDRKEFEERLAAYYWGQSVDEQARFLKAHGVDPALYPRRQRNQISTVIAGMSDLALGALAQKVLVDESVR